MILQKFVEKVIYGFGFGLGMGASWKLFPKPSSFTDTTEKPSQK